jgi:hypothetical protein
MTDTHQVDAVAAAAPQRSKARSISAVVCLLLAALLTVPAAFAYWGQRTLNDTQRYVATVGPLIDAPAVQDAIATRVTDVIDKQVDVKQILNNVFSGVITDRPRLQQLIGPVSGAVDSLVDSQVRQFIASDGFADIWVAVNTKAQQALIRVLKGDRSGAVSVKGDQIVLDLGELITQVEQRLSARGLTIVDNLPIPQVDRQIVLVDAPQLKQLRNIYAFTNPVARWLIVVVALLYLAALLLARRRARMTAIIGLAIAANALLVALLLSTGRQLFINELSGTAFGPASSVFYDTLLTYLQRGRQVLFWVGVTFVVIGWFAGRTASGTAVRTWLSDGLASTGASLAGGRVGSAGVWVAANARWLRIAAGALGAAVLLWGNTVTLGRLFWSLALVAALLAILQILIGAATKPRPIPRAPAVPAEAPTG